MGMVLTATVLKEVSGVRIITFELMSNHVHFILYGTKEDVELYFTNLKLKLRRLLKISGKIVDLKGFKPNIIAIDDLESLRNQIVYTNRNNYLVDPSQTPFSYPYGANGYYFNPTAKALYRSRYGDLNTRERRDLVHSRDMNYPDSYCVVDNHFSPFSYCDIKLGEAFFRDARHYFYKVSRDIESYKEVASLTGDLTYYTDDELYAAAIVICRNEFGGMRPALLPTEQKKELATRLHYGYNANNKQISRLTKLSENFLCGMFGK